MQKPIKTIPRRKRRRASKANERRIKATGAVRTEEAKTNERRRLGYMGMNCRLLYSIIT